MLKRSLFVGALVATTCLTSALPAAAGTFIGHTDWTLPNSSTLGVDSYQQSSSTFSHIAVASGGSLTSPVTYNANESRSGQLSTFTGTATQSGLSAPFSCTINNSTGAISGNTGCAAYRDVLLGLGPKGQEAQTQALSDARAVVNTEINRTQSQQLARTIGRRITATLANRPASRRAAAETGTSETAAVSAGGSTVGMSAGEGGMNIGVWATYSHNWLSNDWEAAKSSGGLNTGVAGADFRVSDNAVVGMTVSYQAANIDTSYDDGRLDGGTYSFVPYGALSLMDGRLVLDALTGVGFGNTDVERNRSIAGIKGSYDSTRWLLGTNATYNYPVDKLTLSGKVGWLMAYEWADGYSESTGGNIGGSTSKLGEVSVGGRAAYNLDTFEPYVSLTYLYDAIMSPNTIASSRFLNTTSFTTSTQSADRDEVEGVIGFNWMPSDRLTAGVEVSHSFFREKENNTALMVNARYTF
jgi:hypothetical protein